jgi:tryptophan synthase alpha chain
VSARGATSTRLARAFEGSRKKLVIYMTSGDPSLRDTVAIVRAAAGAGADVIELGIPFSDPSADGPAIQLAMERALAGGATLGGTLEVVRELRASGCEVPIVLFGYYNPVFVRGVDRFCREAAQAGADGLLVVDLPVDEMGELLPAARAAGLDVVPLVAPTSPAPRIARIAEVGAPFVYYVSMTGITGAALRELDELPARVRQVRETVRAPVAVGFGIATPDDARRVAASADAVVVGSAVVRAIEKNPGREAVAVGELVASLAGAIR